MVGPEVWCLVVAVGTGVGSYEGLTEGLKVGLTLGLADGEAVLYNLNGELELGISGS